MKDAIINGKTALGIEFGSTRIKAVLVDDKNNLIGIGTEDSGLVPNTHMVAHKHP